MFSGDIDRFGSGPQAGRRFHEQCHHVIRVALFARASLQTHNQHLFRPDMALFARDRTGFFSGFFLFSMAFGAKLIHHVFGV
jgi:hypothetical protein